VEEEVWGLLDFVSFVYVWVYFCCCNEGACVRDFRGLRVLMVGTVDWSLGGECVGGRGSVATSWRKDRRGRQRQRERVDEKGCGEQIVRIL
jgi:hypothetical protein